MNPTYLTVLMLFLILFLIKRNQKRLLIKQIIKKRNSEDKIKMTELAKIFIEKKCIFSSFDGNRTIGTLKEVTNGAALIENNGNTAVINLDFVTKISEYPKKKKNGKNSD